MKWIELETVLEIHNSVIKSTGGSYNSPHINRNIVYFEREALEKEKIEARPLWKPMHLQPFYKNLLKD